MLTDDVFRTIEPDWRGWLWSEKLDAWIGLWKGEYHRIHDAWPRLVEKSGAMLVTEAKSLAANNLALQEEVARLQASLTAQGLRPENGKSQK